MHIRMGRQFFNSILCIPFREENLRTKFSASLVFSSNDFRCSDVVNARRTFSILYSAMRDHYFHVHMREGSRNVCSTRHTLRAACYFCSLTYPFFFITLSSAYSGLQREKSAPNKMYTAESKRNAVTCRQIHDTA